MKLHVQDTFKAIILWLTFCFASGIRNLKGTPMVDADGREYKTPFPHRNANVRKDMSLTGESAILVKCTESSMRIVTKADLYGIGRHVFAEELRLGYGQLSKQEDVCQAVPASDTEFVIEAGLHECGSQLTSDDDTLVYSNVLVYSPTLNEHGIIRMTGAVIPVQCHYMRTHFVSSNGMKPTWTPYTSTRSAMELLGFSFRLMNDNWRFERSSNVYKLGEVMNIEASVRDADHVSLRIFMDSCVATLEPDTDSVPRYAFVQKHGCLTDAMEADSNARFMPRTQTNKLQLKMDAFRFHQDSRDAIYITCHLKVADAAQDVNAMKKACTYSRTKWQSADGSDEVCGCCDSSCDVRDSGSPIKGSRAHRRSKELARTVRTIGPVIVKV